MLKSNIPIPEFYDRYIGLVPEEDLNGALAASLAELDHLDTETLAALGSRVYAPGKWTVSDIFQHILDTERIMAYRALRFARKDRTPLPAFEENDYAVHARANDRSLTDILQELKATRISETLLFQSFNDGMLLEKGTCSGREVTVAALGFIIAGHQFHHLNVIRERYLPLIP